MFRDSVVRIDNLRSTKPISGKGFRYKSRSLRGIKELFRSDWRKSGIVRLVDIWFPSTWGKSYANTESFIRPKCTGLSGLHEESAKKEGEKEKWQNRKTVLCIINSDKQTCWSSKYLLNQLVSCGSVKGKSENTESYLKYKDAHKKSVLSSIITGAEIGLETGASFPWPSLGHLLPDSYLTHQKKKSFHAIRFISVFAQIFHNFAFLFNSLVLNLQSCSRIFFNL